MSCDLPVLKDGQHPPTLPLEAGALLPGVHGGGDSVLGDDRVPSEICRVDVRDGAQVLLRALPQVAFPPADGA